MAFGLEPIFNSFGICWWIEEDCNSDINQSVKLMLSQG